MNTYLPIAGTWNWTLGDPAPRHWWAPESPFAAMMTGQGFRSIGDGEPFLWSTDLGGMTWTAKLLNRSGLETWGAAGYSLKLYLCPPEHDPSNPIPNYVPVADRRVIAHSHGGQVALMAAAAGLKIHRLITVATPVRADMRPTIRAALPNIGAWLHLYGDWHDRWQWLGELMDGSLGIERRFRYFSVMNEAVQGIGHSDLLENPDWFWAWKERGWLEFLRGR